MDAPNNLIYYPSCPHLINCLTRNISESRHLAAVQNIMIRSIAANYSRGTLTTEINTSFALRNAPAATGVRRPENLYPGFIGHPDFVRPMSSRFLMSVLAVVGGGIAALIVAFALLHAAALATTGVAVAAVGAGLLLGSVGMFHRERNKNASEGGLIDLPTLA
ncbi:MAG: hypothetical protein NXI01_00380 [Gammaproteobacteria bacterium]|nr:hypothetical protein [Gammaproteobacteria bacterium]